MVYLVGAPFHQLSRRFRERHFTVHRRLGRVLLPAGLIAGIFAIVFGTMFGGRGAPGTAAQRPGRYGRALRAGGW